MTEYHLTINYIDSFLMPFWELQSLIKLVTLFCTLNKHFVELHDIFFEMWTPENQTSNRGAEVQSSRSPNNDLRTWIPFIKYKWVIYQLVNIQFCTQLAHPPCIVQLLLLFLPFSPSRSVPTCLCAYRSVTETAHYHMTIEYDRLILPLKYSKSFCNCLVVLQLSLLLFFRERFLWFVLCLFVLLLSVISSLENNKVGKGQIVYNHAHIVTIDVQNMTNYARGHAW